MTCATKLSAADAAATSSVGLPGRAAVTKRRAIAERFAGEPAMGAMTNPAVPEYSVLMLRCSYSMQYLPQLVHKDAKTFHSWRGRGDGARAGGTPAGLSHVCQDVRHRTREVEALRVVDAERAHPLDLLRGLEPLHRHLHAERARQRGDGAHDLVAAARVGVEEERAVDLDHVERELP